MNPISGMLAEAQLAYKVLPTILRVGTNIAAHKDEIMARTGELVSGLRKAYDDAKHLDFDSAEADIGAAYKAGYAVYKAVGIDRETVQSIVGKSATDIPSLGGLQSAIEAGESFAKSLGLPI